MTTNNFALNKSIDEKLFRLLVASVKDYAIFLIDKNGNILTWNQGAQRIKGYREDEILGKNISLFYTPEDQQKKESERLLAETLKRGVYESEGWRVRKDGTRFWANIVFTALYDDQKQLVGIAKVTRDVTEQKRLADQKDLQNSELEQKVKEQTDRILATETRFKKLIEYSHDGIVLLDADMNILYRSISSEQITGWSIDEVEHRSIAHRVHPDDEPGRHELLEKVRQTPNKPFKCMFRLQHKNGNYIWVESVYTNHLNDPEIKAIVCNFRDITEIKTINETLEKKVLERTEQLENVNKELESFSYSVSHDLRAPLRAVNGYAMMLKEDFGQILDQEGNRLLDTITSNARLMGTLIDDLLTFSRLGRKELVCYTIDMNAVVEACINDLKNQTGKYAITVHTLPACEADSSLIKQVWLNLIGNSLKYSSKKENPEIEIGAIEPVNQTEQDYFTYYIKDNGAGFDMQYQDKLFGVFQRLHRQDEFEGTGVGLALVKRIITRHGGDIWAEAEPNKGATFYFTLPKEIKTTKY